MSVILTIFGVAGIPGDAETWSKWLDESLVRWPAVIIGGLSLLSLSVMQDRRLAEAMRALREATLRAEREQQSAKGWRRLAAAAQRLFEAEEQSRWTECGISWRAEDVPRGRLEETPALLVEVTTDQPLKPIHFRFWFDGELADTGLVRLLGRGIGEQAESEPVQASGGGRVDVYFPDKGMAQGSKLRLYVTAAGSAPLGVLRVQRPKEFEP